MWMSRKIGRTFSNTRALVIRQSPTPVHFFLERLKQKSACMNDFELLFRTFHVTTRPSRDLLFKATVVDVWWATASIILFHTFVDLIKIFVQTPRTFVVPILHKATPLYVTTVSLLITTCFYCVSASFSLHQLFSWLVPSVHFTTTVVSANN